MNLKPSADRTWWLWNPATRLYEQQTLPVFEILRPRFPTPRLRWFAAQNPFPMPKREYMVLEAGTGYVLSFGKTMEAAINTGKRRFYSEVEGVNESGCFQFIRGQQDLLRRFCGHLPGFTLPQPEDSNLVIATPTLHHDQFYTNGTI